MNLSINWFTKVITVQRTDLSLIQSIPSEIRSMDLNAFRLALKDLEDSEEGVVWPDTHRHNTEVSLSGITFARVIEIINDYTITFTDDTGPYAVNLSGANSNIADRVNVNQVSVRSANSAGMTSSPAIEYASFNGGVTIDTVNGIDSVIYPAGTPLQPCKTVINSATIRKARGLSKVFMKSDLTLENLPDGQLDNLEIIGVTGFRLHTLTFNNCLMTNCTATNINVTGIFKNGSTGKIKDCNIYDIHNASVVGDHSTIEGGTYSNTELYDCTVFGDIKLDAGAVFSGVGTVFDGDFTNIDLQGLVSTVSLDVDSGYCLIKNSTPGCLLEFNYRGGELELDDSCTGGDFYAEGYGTLFGDPVALGMDVKGNHLLALETIPGPIWDEPASNHLTTGSFGNYIQKKLLTLAKFLGLK